MVGGHEHFLIQLEGDGNNIITRGTIISLINLGASDDLLKHSHQFIDS